MFRATFRTGLPHNSCTTGTITLVHLDWLRATCLSRTGKLAGADKKLYKYLEHRYQDELNHSPNSIHLHMSPFGPMTLPACRRTLCHLIATLNASYPDYDFS